MYILETYYIKHEDEDEDDEDDEDGEDGEDGEGDGCGEGGGGVDCGVDDKDKEDMDWG